MTDLLTRLFEPDVLADPSTFYRQVRAEHPVYRDPSGFYAMTTHANALWMFRSPRMRSLDRQDFALRYPAAMRHRVLELLLDGLGNINPPRHTRLRRLLSRDFTVRRMRELQPMVEQVCDGLLDAVEERLRDGEVVDLHTEITIPLALGVISNLVGVPESDRPAIAPLVVRILQATHPAATEAMLDDADEASSQVETYFLEMIARRRVAPDDGLMSALVSVHQNDPDQLSDSELITWVWGLWAGGFETSACAQDNATILLLTHPQHAHHLREGQDQVTAFAGEALRFEPPSLLTGVVRITAEEVTIGDVTIPEGADVRTLTGCANRDPAVFADGDRFDPLRDTTASLVFGSGLHYCLGAHLARTQLHVLLPRLHARFPTLTLAGPPVRRRTLPLRACDHLPVALSGKELS